MLTAVGCINDLHVINQMYIIQENKLYKQSSMLNQTLLQTLQPQHQVMLDISIAPSICRLSKYVQPHVSRQTQSGKFHTSEISQSQIVYFLTNGLKLTPGIERTLLFCLQVKI